MARENEGENTMNGICEERGSLKENRNKMALSLTTKGGSWTFLRHIMKKMVNCTRARNTEDK